jgi:hypothetical protein
MNEFFLFKKEFLFKKIDKFIVLNRSNNKKPSENSKPAIPNNKNVNDTIHISSFIKPNDTTKQYKTNHIISEKKINVMKLL